MMMDPTTQSNSMNDYEVHKMMQEEPMGATSLYNHRGIL